MTSATVGRDLLQALVQEIKLLPSVWVKLPKAKQDDVIDRLRSRVEANVKMAVHLIASEGRSVIVGECKKVNIADEVKSEFVVSRKDHKAFHDLCDAQGKACLLVVAEANQHTQGMEEICGEADQRAMDLGHEYDPNSDGKGMDGNSGDNDHVIDAEVKAIAHRPLDSELRQAHADGYKAASEGLEGVARRTRHRPRQRKRQPGRGGGMKLSALNVNNFLGLRAVQAQLTTPVTLFAGKNGAGKSSLQEAVRMALTGEAVRVDLKKEYGQLVTEGADSGFAEVEINGAARAFVRLPDGKTTPLTEYVPPKALPYVLDAQRFARLAPNERRAFLFGLMGVSASGVEVKKRLLAKGCSDQKVETIMPILCAGFDAAHKDAQAKARDEKTAWRAITGETYGDKKAATWAAEKPVFDATVLADLQQRLADTEAGLAAANQCIGALQADHKRYTEAAQRLAELREKGSRYARIADKLLRDEDELKEWEARVESTRQRASGGRKVGLVHDLAYSLNESLRMVIPFGEMDGRQRTQLADANATLEKYSVEHGNIESAGAGDPEARNKLPEYEKAMSLLQSAVANDKRDLADADAAAKTIAELEAAVGTAPDEAKIHAARKHLDNLKAERCAIAAKLAAQQDAEQQVKQADERTAKALAAHESVLAWIAIADALAPEGIPGEMLAEALMPLNERLTASAEIAQWARVCVTRDMQVLASGRPYALLSESEKWRADAMLAEAIAYLSQIKLLVLDRFDVLDLNGREDLIAWLDILAQDGEINTALIFGTLKALPANLPQTIAAHWLDSGVVTQLREVA
ncbi:hypothetical protein DFQ28_008026 [Apophysomyces sp. BC1034]|nr:hypothetical protein DFQ28_008026 [Apophysomyces sp. BC1034]